MPRAKISEFSTTAGDNTDIDGINLAEGCAPSGINDAIRELMAQLKDFQSGAAGDNITVVGTLAAKGTSASGADLKLYEDTDNGTNYVGFMAPASIASNVQWTLPSADGTANQVLSTNGSGVLSWASGGNVSTSANNAFTGANTFYNATGQTFGTATSSEDGIIVAGRAGGSSSYRVTLTPGTLTASRTATFPDATTTIAGLSVAQTFTATQTFSGSSSALAMVLNDAAEVATVSATAATGTINYDITTQSVLYYTSNASANWTVNFRASSGTSLNTALATGQSMTVAFLVTQGSTAYYNNSIQIDGTTSGVTVRWLGGAPTAGNASGIDSYRYLIIKTGSAAYTVLASVTQFKA
jgi:hypothetical protein